MVLIIVKESKYSSKCAREGCDKKTQIGKPYVFDTEAKNAYCSEECGEMHSGLKLVKNNGNGGLRGGGKPFTSTDLWRKPDEAVTAIDAWQKIAIPKIEETIKKFPLTFKTSDQQWKLFVLYEEIFLGKMKSDSKN